MLHKLTDRDWPITLALAVFAVVIIACGYWTSESIKEGLLRHDARDEGAWWLQQVQQDIAPEQQAHALTLAHALSSAPSLDSARFSRVFRYRLFDLNGYLLLDSEAGKDPALASDARPGASEEVVTQAGAGASFITLRHGKAGAAPADSAEIYMPVLVDGEPRAIAGVHVDQTVKAARLDGAFRVIGGITIFLLCLAVLVPAWLLIRRSDEKRSRDQQIDFIARHDKVTGLINRMEFLNRLSSELRASEGQHYHYAVLCLGIDGMKTINNTLGRLVGDAALREVAARCGKLVPEGSLIGRLDGDEIAIALRHSGPHEALGVMASELRSPLCEPFEAGGKHLSLNLRIGVAAHTHPEIAAADLLKNAYVALNWAKSENAGMVRLFSQDMDTALAQRVEIEMGLGFALERGEFEVYYQPQFDLKSGALRVAEALVRWRHPDLGLISPDRFIPLTERSGLIHELGAWILREACRHATTWPEHVCVAVNLSPAQFSSSTLATMVLDVLEDTGLDPARLELEITESLFMANMDGVYETLKRLRSAGVAIAMDDFGTGYSSLSYLSRFPFTKLKIDRSFIFSMEEDKAAVSIVQAIIGLGHSLNMTVTAEGVETVVQAEALRAMGCELGQGYLFAKPMPAGDFTRLFLPDTGYGAAKGRPRLRVASSAA